ncbi:MAG: hypothetical protein HY287_00125 [Planctomycetes bacterium]|nr:hypothetical protein [Planctomycetota bacterium]MBI3832718.1 hypothetical protein [Planctomycetota bacterium]
MNFTRNMTKAHRILYAVSGIALIVVPFLFDMANVLRVFLIAFGLVALVESYSGY